MPRRCIQVAERPVTAVFRAPPSKSVTHRALMAAALASGTSTIVEPLAADDTTVTARGLASMGIAVRIDEAGWEVDGCSGRVPGGGDVRLFDSGTSFRFLTALAALGERPSSLDGSARLRQRPVRELAEVLSGLGAELRLATGGGGLPLEASGAGRIRGGEVVVPARSSSQFASALMLIGPRLPGGLRISLSRPAVSVPYVEVTAAVLTRFGVEVQRVDEATWQVPEGDFRGRRYRVEGDHSSASYLLAAAALTGGRVRVDNLDPDSAQPDARLGGILAELDCDVRSGADWIEVEGSGSIPGFDLEMSGAPDLVPTLAVLALHSTGPVVVRGVAHLRLKESDRLELIASNVRRLGRGASTTEDTLRVAAPGAGGLSGAELETGSDHRIAMAFALAGLRTPGVVIDDAECVSKSNPGFWEDFERLEGGSTTES